MQARIVAAARGARWLGEGWSLFRRAPLGWLLLVFAYLAITQFLAMLPRVGSAIAAILIPGFTLGFMAVSRAAARGDAVELRLLFEGFREDGRRQLALGAAYMGLGVLVIGATLLADADGVFRAVLSGERRVEEADSAGFAAPLATFALAYTPVMMMFWFAPALCAWHSVGVGKSLFFSFFGFLLNWRAFLVYGALVAAISLVLPLVAVALLSLASVDGSRVPIIGLVFALLLVLLPMLFASFYASYRDVFGYDAAA
jgi:hypothetical protein